MFNPFELHGADFLGFFLMTLILTIPSALVLRYFFRLPAGNADAGMVDTNPYELAYILGGQQTGVAAGIAGLVQRKVLTLEAETGVLMRKKELPLNASLVEQAIYNVVGTEGQTVRGVVTLAGELLHDVTDNARQRGLVLTPVQSLLARWVPAGLMLVVIGIGCTQMFLAKFVREGTHRIGFLALLTVIPAVAAYLFARWKPHLTLRGESLLSQARKDNDALRISASKSPRSLSHDDMALAVGLFGSGILADSAMKGLHKSLSAPAPRKGSLGSYSSDSTGVSWWFFSSGCGSSSSCGSGWSSWSSCSSSSCSSSSCGGGGGCGGGGCGGCGG